MLATAACLEPPVDPAVAELASRAFLLDELVAWPVAEPELIRGGVVEPGGSAVIWTALDEVLVFTPGEPEPEARPDLEPPVIFVEPASAPPGAFARSRAEGTFVRVSAAPDAPGGSADEAGLPARCPSLAGALAVVAAPGGLLALDHVGGTPLHRVSAIEAGGAECEVIAEVPVDCAGSTPGIVGPRNGVLFAGCPDPARPLLRIDLSAAGMRVGEVDASVPSTFENAPGAAAQWTVMPLLRVDGGLFRVLADVRSDLTRFEFWSDEGVHVRTTALAATVGFFASSPDDQLLLGLRDDPTSELVVYAWSWGSVLPGR